MSCTGCAEKFGFLKKEYGCPKCKFSYCKKCLRFQIMDSKTSKPLMVCLKCHQAVQTGAKEPIAVMRALHRLESMDDPAKPPITVYRQPVTTARRLQELKQGLSLEDQQLLERLESLKRDDSNEKSSNNRRSSEKMEEEIAERLARLKGEEYNPGAKAATNFRNIKPETEEDIIAKFANQVELDSKYEASVVNDLEARLAKLKGDTGNASSSKDPVKSAQPHSSGRSGMVDPDEEDELTETEQVERIMRQMKDELAISGTDAKEEGIDIDHTESTDQPMQESDESDIDVDELCGICSEKRAVLLCKECDDDIYCKACFQELHRDLGEMHAAKEIQFKKH